MMSEVLAFEQHKIRVVRNGELWFVLADVCGVLGLGNVTETAKRLDDDEFNTVEVTDSIGRLQKTLIVSEAGVYKIAHTSRKPVAKRFVRWVCHEVLPSIRRTGRYVAPGALLPPEMDDLLDQKFQPVHRKLDSLSENVGKVLALGRREPNASTKRVQAKTINYFYFGGCPCGECRTLIMENKRYKMRGVDWDYHHQFGRMNAGIYATIPLAKACHERIERDPEARLRFETAFSRWVENIKKMQNRPPEQIQQSVNDVEFFVKAKQLDWIG